MASNENSEKNCFLYILDEFVKNKGLLYFTEYGNVESLLDSEINSTLYYGLIINSDNSLYTTIDNKSVSILSPRTIISGEGFYDFNKMMENMNLVFEQIVFWNAFKENQSINCHLIIFPFQIEN